MELIGDLIEADRKSQPHAEWLGYAMDFLVSNDAKLSGGAFSIYMLTMHRHGRPLSLNGKATWLRGFCRRQK
jgi:hypothetical protein